MAEGERTHAAALDEAAALERKLQDAEGALEADRRRLEELEREVAAAREARRERDERRPSPWRSPYHRRDVAIGALVLVLACGAVILGLVAHDRRPGDGGEAAPQQVDRGQ